MVTCGSASLVVDDFDAVMAVIDAWYVRERHKNVIRRNSVIKNILSAKKSG